MSRARASRSAGRVWKRMRAAGRLKHDLTEYVERLDREINMIQQMKFSGYFLDRLGLHPLRESRTASRSARAADRRPAAWSAMPWRSPISILCSTACSSSASSIPSASACPTSTSTSARTGRGEVIQYVTEKYGREQVAQIITFGTLGARGRH